MTACSPTVTIPQQSSHTQNCVTDDWISSAWTLHQHGVLTQACIVWTFINSLAAAGVCGSLRPLDPNRVMAAFAICLTPPASKTKFNCKKGALSISFLWVNDNHTAQEHHPVSDDLKCIPLSSIISSYRPPKTCITCSY